VCRPLAREEEGRSFIPGERAGEDNSSARGGPGGHSV
jgi:hypothetical protein